jgi:hypothetical protein
MSLKQLASMLAGPSGLLILIFFFLPWVSVSCEGASETGSDETIFTASGQDLAQGVDQDDFNSELTEGLEQTTESAFSDIGDDSITFESSSSPDLSSEFSNGEDSAFDADALLYLIPMIGLFGLVTAAIGFFETRFLNLFTGAGLLLAPGLLGGLLLIWKYMQMAGEISDANSSASQPSTDGSFTFGPTPVIKLDIEYGFVLVFIGLAGLFIAGVMVMMAGPEPALAAPALPKAKLQPQAMPDWMSNSAPSSAPPPTSPETFAPTRVKPRSAEELKAQLERAKVHIQAKRYPQARAILNDIDHPTAAKWLAKLDEIDPFG